MRNYAYILIVLSIVGLIASSVLMSNTVKIAEDPSISLPCNINPLLSCTSVATKWQSKVFGFPNPILGIISFSMLLAIGLLLASGSKINKLIAQSVNFGILLSMVFVIWFFYQSVYQIGNLCLYCMVVWVVTWPLFLYTTIWNYREDNLKENVVLKFVAKNHLPILLAVYLLAIILILLKFKDFFLY